MRGILITSAILAALAVAMVAVCENAEVCRLRYRVWDVQKRRDSLQRQIRETQAALQETRTPKALLEGLVPNRITPATRPGDARPRTGTRPARGTQRRQDLRWFNPRGVR